VYNCILHCYIVYNTLYTIYKSIVLNKYRVFDINAIYIIHVSSFDILKYYFLYENRKTICLFYVNGYSFYAMYLYVSTSYFSLIVVLLNLLLNSLLLGLPDQATVILPSSEQIVFWFSKNFSAAMTIQLFPTIPTLKARQSYL